MIRHVWTVACIHAVVDQESNLVSLLDVIEQINIPEKPSPNKAIGLTLDLTSLWVREDPQAPEQGHAKITFITPSGNELKSLPMNIDLSEHERLRTRGRFVGLPAPENGRYTFRVELAIESTEEWNVVASIPIRIMFSEEKHPEPNPVDG
jgi:hypothetical protein